ncbi:MAG: TolC family protein [Bacilli bacterium]
MNKNFFENLALAVSAAVLCGCMVGPDFEKPQPKLGETWNQEISGKLLTDGEESKKVSPEEIARWWEIFEDEQLTSLIKRAFENNLDLAAATATIAQARANLGIVQSGFFPTLDLSVEA